MFSKFAWLLAGKLVCVVLSGGSALGLEHRKITAKEAEGLVRDYVWLHCRHLKPQVELVDFSPYDGEFYYFFVWTSRYPAGVAIGHYAVNPWTGHVWDTIFCRIVSSPGVKKKLEAIRRRFKYTDEQYSEMRTKKPSALCE